MFLRTMGELFEAGGLPIKSRPDVSNHPSSEKGRLLHTDVVVKGFVTAWYLSSP